MSATIRNNTKFTTTVCSSSTKTRKFRSDIGPMDSQFEAVSLATKDLKTVHHGQAQQAMQKTKGDHIVMLLQLLAEANNFHATNTQLFVCKINRECCAPNVRSGKRAGLSSATMKALVTDIDIVMDDDDKDNYQHALSAIAALSLWH